MGTDLHFACFPVVVDKSSVHFYARGDIVLSGGELQVFLTPRCLPEVSLRIGRSICSVIRRNVGGKHMEDSFQTVGGFKFIWKSLVIDLFSVSVSADFYITK